MHPKVSQAEIDVMQALSGSTTIQGMTSQKLLILKFTVPDFCWVEKKKVVYLDGRHVHSSDKARQRDEEIDNLLELQGWDVLRIKYDPPLKGKNLRKVVAQIKEFRGGCDE